MIQVQSHVDLPSSFGGVLNRVDFACDTYRYLSINDITREDNVWVLGEVNVSGFEQCMPKDFTRALKSESLHRSYD